MPLFEPTFDPRRLREVPFVAVEEPREDESRPRHVQVRLDPDQQADLVLANNQGALSRRRRAPNAIPHAYELYRTGWSLARPGQDSARPLIPSVSISSSSPASR